MSAEPMEEKWADWCASDGSLAMTGTRMKEGSRRSLDDRWCFHHRTHHEFFQVVMVPDGLSYYGPHIEIKGPADECTDLFPGWTREWSE